MKQLDICFFCQFGHTCDISISQRDLPIFGWDKIAKRGSFGKRCEKRFLNAKRVVYDAYDALQTTKCLERHVYPRLVATKPPPYPLPIQPCTCSPLTLNLNPPNERQYPYQVHFRNKHCKAHCIQTWGSGVLE